MNLYIRKFGTKEIVETVNVTGKSQLYIERTIMGMLRNLNREEYYVDDSETDTQQDKYTSNGLLVKNMHTKDQRLSEEDVLV